MHELHKREQYFFDPPTVEQLAAFVQQFSRPMLLCCPMVGRYLWERKVRVPVLDVDARFADLPGFIRWDVYRPQALPHVPDLIVCDPPFNIVRLDQLYAAVRVLAKDDPTTGLLVAGPPSRSNALMGTFGRWGLRPTGFRPTYVTVPDEIGIEFYGNVPDERLVPLRTS